MAERHGKNSRVMMDGVVIKCASMDLNMTMDQAEVTAFGDTNKRYVNGMKDFKAAIAGFWDDANDKLFDVVDAAVPVLTYLYPDAVNAPAQYWYGLANVDASLASSVTTAVSISGTISAAGNFTRVGI